MTRPNARRTAKMRNLTLTDEAWRVLTRLATLYGSRSAAVDAWLTGANTDAGSLEDVRWARGDAAK
jgi:hypothetical protein